MCNQPSFFLSSSPPIPQDNPLTIVSCFAETPLLIPLTTSLYVPATLASGPPDSSSSSSSEKSSSAPSVLVDIGTGFFVEKSPEDGIKFYKGKVDDLTKNLVEIEKAVGGKNENLRLIEDGK
jgi:prefoldin alpha subunit